MSTDALTRLRAADPCPTAAGYDDTVAQHNIDTIVRTDLVVRPAPVRRSRRRRVWPALVATAVVVLIAGSVQVALDRDEDIRPSPGSSAHPSAPTEVSFFNGLLGFTHPSTWISYPPAPPSTMDSDIVYLSSVPIPGPCTTTTPSPGTEAMTCSLPVPDLRQGGTFVSWGTLFSFGPSTLDGYPGRATVIGGVDARVDSAVAPACEQAGAVAGVDAVLRYGNGNGLFTMTACIGPGDVATELAAVDRMLASVSFATLPTS